MNGPQVQSDSRFDLTHLRQIADYQDSCGFPSDAEAIRTAIRHIRILDSAYETSQKLNKTLREQVRVLQHNLSSQHIPERLAQQEAQIKDLQQKLALAQRRAEASEAGCQSATARAEKLLVEIADLRTKKEKT